MDEKIMKLEQEIRNLQCELTASDYKILKCYEAQQTGAKELPYDLKAVCAERQAKRDKINEIQKTIAKLQK